MEFNLADLFEAVADHAGERTASDLGLRRTYKMINRLAVISFARQGKPAVLRMRVTCWGYVHAGSLHATVPLPRDISG